MDLRGFNFSASSAKQFVDFSVTATDVDVKLGLYFESLHWMLRLGSLLPFWQPTKNHHATATLAKDTLVSDNSVEALASVSRFGRGPVGW